MAKAALQATLKPTNIDLGEGKGRTERALREARNIQPPTAVIPTEVLETKLQFSEALEQFRIH